MVTILLILLNVFSLLLYHLLMRRKVIKPLQFSNEKLIERLESLIGDVRHNNQEFVRRTDGVIASVNKIKSEHSTNIRQNKNEIIKLKSQVGRIRK